MDILTSEQKNQVVKMMTSGSKKADIVEFLYSSLTINSFQGDESRIFKKGFAKGYTAAAETIAFFLEKFEQEDN